MYISDSLWTEHKLVDELWCKTVMWSRVGMGKDKSWKASTLEDTYGIIDKYYT